MKKGIDFLWGPQIGAKRAGETGTEPRLPGAFFMRTTQEQECAVLHRKTDFGQEGAAPPRCAFVKMSKTQP